MTNGYFLVRGSFRRPYIDVVVIFHDADDQSLAIPFEVDTGADRTLLSPSDGQRLNDELGIDIQAMPRGNPVGGIGGIVETRTVRATLVIGDYRTTLRLPIVDVPAGPNTAPSLIGRDIIYDFALFMEHSADRLFLLRTGEEIIPLLES